MADPALPADLSAELRDLRERLAILERSPRYFTTAIPFPRYGDYVSLSGATSWTITHSTVAAEVSADQVHLDLVFSVPPGNTMEAKFTDGTEETDVLAIPAGLTSVGVRWKHSRPLGLLGVGFNLQVRQTSGADAIALTPNPAALRFITTAAVGDAPASGWSTPYTV